MVGAALAGPSLCGSSTAAIAWIHAGCSGYAGPRDGRECRGFWVLQSDGLATAAGPQPGYTVAIQTARTDALCIPDALSGDGILPPVFENALGSDPRYGCQTGDGG